MTRRPPSFILFPYTTLFRSWSSPFTSRVLFEAGWGTYQARYRNNAPRIDGTHHPLMVRLVDQGGEIQNLARSEEHTSELQSQSKLVCRLLLEKKKIRWPSRS